MWDAAMAENRIIKLGKRTDFECHQIEHQLGAFLNCNHGEGLAVIHPAYYRRIYQNSVAKFKRFAVHIWNIEPSGKEDEEIALAGIGALERFINELGMPASLRKLGADRSTDLKKIADSCGISPGSYRQMTHKEILELLQDCF